MPHFDPADFIIEWLTDDAGVFFRRLRAIESMRTQYQQLDVVETQALGAMFRLDGCNMTSERDEFFYHENIVHPGAIAQHAPERALVIGGGDGGAIEEILKYPSMRRVVMAELDPEVIRMARTHLRAVHRGAFDDPRVEIVIGDATGYVDAQLRAPDPFDIIVMDLTDPVGPAAALYTEAFYGSLNALLRPTGTLSLHVGAPFFQPARFVEAMRRLSSVFAIVRPYFVHVPLYGANWGMACVSQRTDPLSVRPQDVDRQIAERRVGRLEFYNGDVHQALFALPNYVRTLLETVDGAAEA